LCQKVRKIPDFFRNPVFLWLPRKDSNCIFACGENNGVAAVKTGGKQGSTGALLLEGFKQAGEIKKD
jgi:hypothetical protein